MTARVVQLPAPQMPTLAKDNVALAIAVSTEPAAQADMVLDVAIKEAIEVLRTTVGTKAYRIARAELRLTLAGHSADRLLGRQPVGHAITFTRHLDTGDRS